MKKLMLYLSNEQYNWIRQQAFKRHISMSAFVKERLTTTVGTSGKSDGPSHSVELPSKPQVKVKKETSNLCKHGYQKGLCKHGCK